MRSIIEPPPAHAIARFSDEFGQRFLLTVDTEEEFDWNKPLTRDAYDLHHLVHLGRFQQFCEEEQVAPVYLIDWPVANSPLAEEILRPAVKRKKAEIGIQLHPWVNPPFEEEVNQLNSFAGNLSRSLEHSKFHLLRNMIQDRFEIAPVMYRAGRYGAGPDTAKMLQKDGIAIDSSVRARFNYNAQGGPNYQSHPLCPYWLDDTHQLLELPLTTSFFGLLRKQADSIYPMLRRFPALRGILSRLGLIERIPLTPEGVSIEEAIRGIDIALDDGLPMLVFSFHSPSLAPGHTPYVRDDKDLDQLYAWFRHIFAYLKQRKVRPASIRSVMDAVIR
ncbi:polysaccharide deacetylase family protein [Altericroceibacterium spongiae]